MLELNGKNLISFDSRFLYANVEFLLVVQAFSLMHTLSYSLQAAQQIHFDSEIRQIQIPNYNIPKTNIAPCNHTMHKT